MNHRSKRKQAIELQRSQKYLQVSRAKTNLMIGIGGTRRRLASTRI